MRSISLTQGKVALVDDADFEWLSQWKWCAERSRNGRFYAVRGEKTKNRIIRMHRAIMGNPLGLQIDHADGDGLNNQRANLRTATHAQNLSNRSKQRNNTTGFKGVRVAKKNPPTSRYVAYVAWNRKRVYVGAFATPEEAARAYDAAAHYLHGEFAVVNYA